MTNHKKSIVATIAVIGGVFFLSGCALPFHPKDQNGEVSYGDTAQRRGDMQNNIRSMDRRGVMGQGEHMMNIDTIAKGDLNDDEKAGIIKMREEEKLARDVYTTLGAKWGQKIFLNITSSEQTHMDEVKQLIDRYALTDPITDGATGVFTSPELQKLYNDLIAKGNVSLVDALNVGATVEDLDIKDLQDLIAATDNADIKYVYENLKNGSQRHLQSFVKNLEKNGTTYTPQYISQTDYDAIISMERQTGGKMDGGCMNSDGSGCGMHDGSGNGQGNGMGDGSGMHNMR
ncbi:MAG: DUF2202 domain-containing protein [Parcubacteria group bacterium]